MQVFFLLCGHCLGSGARPCPPPASASSPPADVSCGPSPTSMDRSFYGLDLPSSGPCLQMPPLLPLLQEKKQTPNNQIPWLCRWHLKSAPAVPPARTPATQTPGLRGHLPAPCPCLADTSPLPRLTLYLPWPEGALAPLHPSAGLGL
ncbi:hypothetical protein HJG60_009387 [Phyllostomus discolor]|uniref:Uncharacterized protein n=1 Tax=Phyllostomus discolor TaxID=89673 RepID=A0A834DDI3_9CHIR|nr:hypothetical protein HJG60_009387 [Phyllostomus discolor]